MTRSQRSGGRRSAAGRLEWRRVVTAAGVAGLAFSFGVFANVAIAQTTPPGEPPLDINQIQPAGQPAKPADATPAAAPKDAAAADAAKGEPAAQDAAKAADGAAAEPAKPAAEPGLPPIPAAPDEKFDGTSYTISRFLLEYRSEHADHPPIDELLQAEADLGVAGGGYVAMQARGFDGRREGLENVHLRIGDVVEGSGGVFYSSAIAEVGQAIVRELNSRGIFGVFIQLHPEDIDETTGKDKRDGKRTDLRLVVWTGKVGQVRSISSGERLQAMIDADASSRINNADPVVTRIRDHSPVQAGDLIFKDEMDDYVFRLNRHPGRRVDIAIASGEKPEEVLVDYLVTESKPWSMYAQLSNTGTESTTELRQRFGFVHNQLTGHDDVLRIDYITGNFDTSNAVVASYEFPIISDVLRLRPYASFAQFNASDVGQSDLSFSGETWGAGVEAIWTAWQRKEMFLDVVGGIRWANVMVETGGFNEGQDNFVLPYVGARFERITEASVTFAELLLEVQLPTLAGTDEDEIQNLGRLEVDDQWENLKFSAEQSFYLEPLLNPRGYRGESGGESGSQTLAHEVAFLAKGQYVFGDRVIANEEEVAGGLFSVRGYPESVVAADSAFIGSVEYRFHLPRVLGMNNPGQYDGRDVGWFGRDFRFTPQQPFGRADWDLILKAFFDFAATKVNDAVATESSETLYGAGVGAEFQWKRNVTARLDWGFALKELDLEGDENDVDSGDNRLHFSITVLY